MNKQKQIEEMANLIHHTEFVDISGYEEEKIAEELLKYYQPKLPENAVVLTEEELTERDYERYNLGYETHRQESQKREDYIETLSHHINDLENALLIARKETAKDILDELDLFFKGTTFRKGYEFKKIDQKLKEMAKNYNVEN